jgi:ubiquinone/menaquinone biosynthesis C-methylase UbiE
VNQVRKLTGEKRLPQREQIQNFFTRTYRNYEDEKIMAYAESGQIAIDVGCAEGILLEKFLNKYPQKKMIGVDVRLDSVMICREHNLPALVSDVYSLSFKDNSIDHCFFMHTLEHLNHDEALSEIRRVLKPGGSVIITVPNDLVYTLTRLATFRWRLALRPRIQTALYPPMHVRQWTPRAIKEWLERSGFEVIVQKNLPLYFWMISLNHLVVARKK